MGGTGGAGGGGGGIGVDAELELVDDAMIDDFDASTESTDDSGDSPPPPRAKGWPRESSRANEFLVYISS